MMQDKRKHWIMNPLYKFIKQIIKCFDFKKCLSEREREILSVVPNSLQPHGLYGPWKSPGQNTGVDSLSLLQGIFPTWQLNPGLLHCRPILTSWATRGDLRGKSIKKIKETLITKFWILAESRMQGEGSKWWR